MLRRQVAGLPVIDTVDGKAAGIIEHHVSRKVFILAAESITRPRTQ